MKMRQEEKLRRLHEIKSESEFRKKLLIPLFNAMDAEMVLDWHGGTLERGKDIIYSQKLLAEERLYTGVVVKIGDLNQPKIRQVITQVQEALGSEFEDKSDKGERKTINRVKIVTSGKITKEAMGGIFNTIRDSKHNIDFLDEEKLIPLIEKHYPDFFFTEFDLFQQYYESLRTKFEHLQDIAALGLPGDLKLEEIFVKLKLSTQEVTPEQDKETSPVEDLIDRTARLQERIIDHYKVLEDFDTMVILGPPGAGKTTLFRHFVLRLCQENLEAKERKTLPVYIELRDLASDKPQNIQEYIKKVLKEYKLSGFDRFLEEDLNDGRVRLFLDGFDEVPKKTDQDRIQHLIEDFVKSFLKKKNKIYIASRIAGYQDELTKYNKEDRPILFQKAEILPFTDDQIKQFLRQWFKDENTIKEIWKILEDNERIKEIARNPLIASFLAIVYKVRYKLPERKTRLYAECIELLMSKWDAIRRVMRQLYFDEEVKKKVLQGVALDMMRQQITTLSTQKICKLIGNHLQRTHYHGEQAKELLDEIEKSSSLLYEVSRGEYKFIHLTFQEYLAAYELHRRKDYQEAASYFQDSFRQETILLFAGIEREIDPLVKLINPTKKEDLILTAKCLADADWTDKEIKQDVAERLLGILGETNRWSNEYEEIRLRIAGIGKDIIPLLAEVLNRSSDFSLSKDVCHILGKIRYPEAIPYLKERLNKEREPNANVRYAAYAALEAIGTKEAMALISKVFVIEPKKLKGNEPFKHTLPDGTVVTINDDGQHPGMVRIPGDKKAPEFRIDVYPVTNAEFEQVFPEHKRSPYSPHDDSPVTLVTWEQANEYARKIGKRLPNEEEWEKAAKGPDDWKYSFGNEFEINKCRVELALIDGAAKINSVYDDNANGYGVYDMSGNIWEWTDSWDNKDRKRRILRGGSWFTNQDLARCAYRFDFIPVNRYLNIGFRCARTL